MRKIHLGESPDAGPVRTRCGFLTADADLVRSAWLDIPRNRQCRRCSAAAESPGPATKLTELSERLAKVRQLCTGSRNPLALQILRELSA